MTNGQRRLAIFAFFVSPPILSPPSHAQKTDETKAVSVLFKQFETVVFTKADFLVGRNRDEEVVDGEDSLLLPFGEFIAGLKVLGPNAETDLEKGYSAVAVGAQGFGGGVGLGPGPDGLGMITSRKCYIAVLGSRAEPDIEPDFRKAFYESVDGRQVWTWSVPQYEGSTESTKFYAAQIAGSYFVMANNKQDFQAVANALNSAESSTATSTSIPGWDSLSAHGYWAYRLFRQKGAGGLGDPGLRGLAPDVTALIFFANAEKREGFVQVVSSDTSMKSIPNVIHGFDPGRFQPQGAGVWQAAIPLSKDEAGFDSIFILLSYFGFAVAL